MFVDWRLIFKPVPTIILLAIGLSWINCQPEEEILHPDFEGGLVFSSDTVLFDTIFSGAGSSTKRLKVYNPSNQAIQISEIALAGGSNSGYSLVIDGEETDKVEDLELLGKDSLLILVKVFIDPKDEDIPYIVNDSIAFATNAKKQHVKLVAWGQDANYLGRQVLECSANWTGARPYILYDTILVDTLCLLTIEKGARIFATKNAAIFIRGSIHAAGTAEKRIIIRNERLDPAYENIPDQWRGIVFLPGSKDNLIEYTTIRNAFFGIYLGTPDNDTIADLSLKNVIIENMAHSGLISYTSDLYAENVLIDNCIIANCANFAGGNYTFKHCTFANYAVGIFREGPSFLMTDYYIDNSGQAVTDKLSIVLQNSIIYGTGEEEIGLDFRGQSPIELAFNTNLLKTGFNDFDTLGNILNEDPVFTNPARYNYRLDTLSPAKDAGAEIGVLIDLDGNPRDELPDIGAFERIE
jgi:hypothetical protein